MSLWVWSLSKQRHKIKMGNSSISVISHKYLYIHRRNVYWIYSWNHDQSFKSHDRGITWWRFMTYIIHKGKWNCYNDLILSKDLKIISYLEMLFNRKQCVNHLVLSWIWGCWHVRVIPLILEAGRGHQKALFFSCVFPKALSLIIFTREMLEH